MRLSFLKFQILTKVEAMIWKNASYVIDTDPQNLNVDVIYGFLSTSYWSKDIPRSVVEKSIRHSLCFGIYEKGIQIGFARVISDYATFAYLADVFVLDSHRGKGLSKWLMTCIQSHPELQNLRRWMLATRDAHGLYEQFGFNVTEKPDRLMEIVDMDIYSKKANDVQK